MKLHRILLWAVFIAVIGLFIARIYTEYRTDPAFFAKADSAVFYEAGKHAFRGDEINTPEFHTAVNETREATGAVRYLYPAFPLLLFIPLAMAMPFKLFIWIWLGINIGLLFVLAWVATKHVTLSPQKRLLYWVSVVSLFALFTPIVINFRAGQVNILLAVLLSIHLYLYSTGRQKLSAVVLASMILFKLFPVVLLVPYLIKKKFKFIGYVVTSGLVLTILTIGIVSFDTHNSFMQRSLKQGSEGIHADGLHRITNASFNGALHRYALVDKLNVLNTKDTVSNSEALLALKKRLNKTSRPINKTYLTIVEPIHFTVAVLLLLLLLYISWQNRRNPISIEEISMWIGYVLLAAKDVHSQYAVLWLPLLLMVMHRVVVIKKSSRLEQIILSLSLILFFIIKMKPIADISLPLVFLLLPTGLIGNTLLVVLCGITVWKRSKVLS